MQPTSIHGRRLERTAVLGGVILLTALSAVACGRRQRIRDARMDRYVQNLIGHASNDTGCHPGQLAPQQIASQPDVYTVTGCTQPIEYWLHCGRRGRHCRWREVPTLNEAAAPILACPPQMIQQQMTQAPNVRYANGCGRMAAFSINCNPAGCGWIASGPVQGTVSATPPPPPPADGVMVVPQQAPPPPPPTVVVPAPQASALQSQISQQREAILSCIDGASLSLRMRWTADGQVIVQLPPELAGTAAETCVQAVVGALRVGAGQAGEVVVPVQ